MKAQLSEERQTQLAEYAQRHGQDPAAALDMIVADALDTDCAEYSHAVEGVVRGYADLKAGRTRPAIDFMQELRAKHGF